MVKKLNIDISSLTNDGCNLSWRFKPAELELDILRDGEFTSEIRVDVRARWQGEQIEIDGDIRATGHFTCVRCLTEFDIEIASSFKIVENAEDVFFRVPHGKEKSGIDIMPDIREELILALPDYPLCENDCRGLCPSCGKNLNKLQCDCSTEKFEEDQ